MTKFSTRRHNISGGYRAQNPKEHLGLASGRPMPGGAEASAASREIDEYMTDRKQEHLEKAYRLLISAENQAGNSEASFEMVSFEINRNKSRLEKLGYNPDEKQSKESGP